MSDLRDLYQEVILDHNRNPRNYREMEKPTHKAEGYNPLCGDKVTIYLQVEGDTIKDVSFQGSGCAISKSSASMMTSAIQGKTVQQAHDLFEGFHGMVTGAPGAPIDEARLGKLAVFGGVCEFPARVKCASLAWHTLQAALHADPLPVSTE